jgi:hypothetical protein
MDSDFNFIIFLTRQDKPGFAESFAPAGRIIRIIILSSSISGKN